MSYSSLALVSVALALTIDIGVLKRRLIFKRAFWISYSIIFPFQLLTNWWLTSRNIVMYSPKAIWGPRIAAAPLEDILFGFTLILITLDNWVSVSRRK
jgi:lycopene cyclase domain-containing protein